MKTGKEENRPTPDTDANIWASISGCIRGQHGEPIERCYVPAGFAQTLERQRDRLMAALKDIMAITDRDHAAWHDAKAAIAEVKGGR